MCLHDPTKEYSVGIFSGKCGEVLPRKLTQSQPGHWDITFGKSGSAEGNFFLQGSSVNTHSNKGLSLALWPVPSKAFVL